MEYLLFYAEKHWGKLGVQGISSLPERGNPGLLSCSRFILHEQWNLFNASICFIFAGTFGAGVTIVLQRNEMREFKEIENQCNTTIKPLPGTNMLYKCFLLILKKKICAR